MSERANLLVLVSREDELTWKSVRTLAGLHVLAVDQLNTYDVLCSDDLVFVGSSLDEFITARTTTTEEAAK